MNQLKLTILGVLAFTAAASDALAFGPPGPPPGFPMGGGLPAPPMGGSLPAPPMSAGLPNLPTGGLPSFPTGGGSLLSGAPTPPNGSGPGNVAPGPAVDLASGNAFSGPLNSGNLAINGGPVNSGNLTGNYGTFNNANVNVLRDAGGYSGRGSFGGAYDRGNYGRGAYFWGGYAAASGAAAASSDRMTNNNYYTYPSYCRTYWDPYNRRYYTSSGECTYGTQ